MPPNLDVLLSRVGAYLSRVFSITANICAVVVFLAAGAYFVLPYHLKGMSIFYGGAGDSYYSVLEYRKSDISFSACAGYLPYEIFEKMYVQNNKFRVARGEEAREFASREEHAAQWKENECAPAEAGSAKVGDEE